MKQTITEKTPQIINHKVIIPIWLRKTGGLLLVLNAVYLIILEINLVINLFLQAKIGTFITLITPIGWFCFIIPIIVAFSSIGWFEEKPNDQSNFNYWLKIVGMFIFIFILTHILHAIGAFLGAYCAGMINEWLT